MKICKTAYAIVFLLMVLQNGTAIQAKSRPNSKGLAVVGDRTISVNEFRDVLIHYRKSEDMQKVLETLTPEGKERILSKLIDQKLLALGAKERGLDKEPEVRRAIDNAIDFLLAEFLIKREIDRLDLSDKGLQRYYNANQEEFMTGIQVKARHIVTQTKDEVEGALKEVKRGRDFSEVASERNIDGSKAKGGDLGWVRRGIMVKSFEEILFSLKEGQVSEIVKTSFGFHIIKAEKIDKGKVKPFEAVIENIKKRIIDQHIVLIKEKIKKKYPVQINKELLPEGNM